MIKNKNTNNKVCVLSDTDRKAVKVMIETKNTIDSHKEFLKYIKVREDKEKYREVINLCIELKNKINELAEDDLLIESTFAYIKGEKPIEDIKLYPQKIQYTIESIANFHHSLNKSLIRSVSERQAG